MTSSPPISGTFTSLIADVVVATGAAVWAAAAAVTGAADAVSNFMISLPVETLSPTLIKISFTTPAIGAGTSIEALSPSTLMID